MSIPTAGLTKTFHDGNGSRESSEFEFVVKNNPPAAPSTSLLTAGLTNPLVNSPTPTSNYIPVVTVQNPTPLKPPAFSGASLSPAASPLPVVSSGVSPSPLLPSQSKPSASVSMPSIPNTQAADKTDVETILAESPNPPGVFGWVKGGGIFSKVVEKTKTVTERVITTLDPQMKEFIYSGGDIEVIVASDKENKVNPVREAFQKVFGHATVYGIPSKALSIAEQPVGFASGKQAAHERIVNLRKSAAIATDAVIVSLENFLYEVNEELWIDMSCLIISDTARNINIQCFSQPTNVEAKYINLVKEATPENYPKRWSGFAVPIGNIMSEQLNVPHTAWQEAVTGVHRKEAVLLAATSLAGLYKKALAARVDD